MDMAHKDVGQSLKSFGNTVGPVGCEGKGPTDAGRSQSWRA